MSDERQYLKERAIKLLARREHSRAELWRKLEGATEEPGVLEAVLDELAVEAWQSDARFAESFTRHRIESGYGPLRIRSELQQRGVAGDNGLLSALAEDDWVSMAAEQRVRRFGPEIPHEWREKGRQGRFLAQRGYSRSQIEKALSMAPDEDQPVG